MCKTCDQNAKVVQQQNQIQQRTHAINHQLAAKIATVQVPTTLGINQQLAQQAYQQRINLELQRKSGVRQSIKRHR